MYCTNLRWMCKHQVCLGYRPSPLPKALSFVPIPKDVCNDKPATLYLGLKIQWKVSFDVEIGGMFSRHLSGRCSKQFQKTCWSDTDKYNSFRIQTNKMFRKKDYSPIRRWNTTGLEHNLSIYTPIWKRHKPIVPIATSGKKVLFMP